MGAMNIIYHKRNYNIYSVDRKEFIVHNVDLPFDKHHTHINKFTTAKYLINISLHKTVPKRLSDYLLISLIRLSDDSDYIDRLYMMLQENRSERNGFSFKDKKQNYYNSKCRRCN